MFFINFFKRSYGIEQPFALQQQATQEGISKLLLPSSHLHFCTSFLLTESHFSIKHIYFIIDPDFWGT